MFTLYCALRLVLSAIFVLFANCRKKDKETMWPKLKVMLDPLDTKSTWIGYDTSATKSYTKVDLVNMSEKKAVIVSGWASTWKKESGEKDKPSKKAKIEKAEDGTKTQNDPNAADTADCGGDIFVQVGWDFLADFELRFFGSVALDGRGDSVPLVGEFSKENSTPKLPWQLFGQGWDSLMASEMPSPAFVIKPVSKSAKAGKASKIKTAQITDPGKGKKSGAVDVAGPSCADLSQTAAVALAEEALGMAKASAKKKNKKRKASPQKKKNTAVLSDSIQFVEEPLPLGYKLCIGTHDPELLSTRVDAFATRYDSHLRSSHFLPFGMC